MAIEDPPPPRPTIHCEEHGEAEYCLICRHLRGGAGLGYFAIEAEPGEPAQAWCGECDAVLEGERGWSDRADEMAGWKLICTGCYEQALRGHQLVSRVEGTSPEG